MPDLKSALSAVANQISFDDVEEVDTSPKYPSFSEQLFYWFVANPASTVQEAKAALNLDRDGPVSGRVFQMWTKGLLSRSEGSGSYRYTPTQNVYPTFTIEKRREMMKKAIEARKSKPKKIKVKKVKEPVAKVIALAPKSAPSLNPNPNAEQIVNSMSVGLAKAVYLELKKVFEA
jgi:hypothetical protein